MRRVHEKSIVLGIGIGMIITSIAGLVYSGGENGEQADKLTKEEIISMAKSYGMVEPVHLIEDDSAVSTQTTGKSEDNTAAQSTATDAGNNPTQQQTDGSSAQETAPATQTPSIVNNQGDTETRDIVVEIKSGYNSNKVAQILYEKGVIANKKEFVDVMAKHSATKKINVGSYTFKKNEDYFYIVNTICNIK